MFTGIITHAGIVRALERRGDLRAVIEAQGWDASASFTAIGASVACDGACLTAVTVDGPRFTVDISAETLSRTTLCDWKEGSRVNLERALKVGEELGGHLVTGHVDAVAAVRDVRPEGDSRRVWIDVPAPLRRFIAEKGSVTLAGVSLTVNAVDETGFGINLIPHTWDVTTLGGIGPGSRLNLEVDLVARYLARLVATPAV